MTQMQILRGNAKQSLRRMAWNKHVLERKLLVFTKSADLGEFQLSLH